jgi:hypothetical protein
MESRHNAGGSIKQRQSADLEQKQREGKSVSINCGAGKLSGFKF